MGPQVDERGRVVLPKRLRERYGLEPGRNVTVEAVEGGVLVKPAMQVDEALDRLRGAIHKGNRSPEAPPMDPLRMKKIWEPRT